MKRDLSNAKIYKIFDDEKFYVGSTTMPLMERLVQHMVYGLIDPRQCNAKLYAYFNKTECKNDFIGSARCA